MPLRLKLRNLIAWFVMIAGILGLNALAHAAWDITKPDQTDTVSQGMTDILANFVAIEATGTGQAIVGGTNAGTFEFEGSTADAFETTISVTDPTVDRTITFPDLSVDFSNGIDHVGAVDMDYGSADITDHTFLSDGTGTNEFVLKAGAIDGTEILDDTIANVDINSAAAINASKLADDEIDEDQLSDTITPEDGSLIDFGSNVTSATEGLFLPAHATDCSTATAEGQVCWEEDAKVLSVGDGAAAIAVSGETSIGTVAETVNDNTNGTDVSITCTNACRVMAVAVGIITADGCSTASVISIRRDTVDVVASPSLDWAIQSGPGLSIAESLAAATYAYDVSITNCTGTDTYSYSLSVMAVQQ